MSGNSTILYIKMKHAAAAAAKNIWKEEIDESIYKKLSNDWYVNKKFDIKLLKKSTKGELVLLQNW